MAYGRRFGSGGGYKGGDKKGVAARMVVVGSAIVDVKPQVPDKATAASGSSFNQLLGIKGVAQEFVVLTLKGFDEAIVPKAMATTEGLAIVRSRFPISLCGRNKTKSNKEASKTENRIKGKPAEMQNKKVADFLQCNGDWDNNNKLAPLPPRLQNDIKVVVARMNVPDRFIWRHTRQGIFSVKSAYLAIKRLEDKGASSSVHAPTEILKCLGYRFPKC